MRDLTAVVQVSALAMFNAREDFTLGSPIGSKFIRHDDPWHIAQALQQLAKEALCGLLVTAALDQNVQHVPMLLNSPPEVVRLASDTDKHLFQEPLVAGRRRFSLLAWVRPKRRLHSRVVS